MRIGIFGIGISWLLFAVAAQAQVSTRPLPGQDLNNNFTGNNTAGSWNGEKCIDGTLFTTLQAAINSAPSNCIPPGTYNTTTETLFNAAANGNLWIRGSGANSILSSTGATNKALHVTGTAGITAAPIDLAHFAFLGNTSGTGAALLHLDGIAHYRTAGLWFNGANKTTNCLQLTAAQQAEVSGGQFQNCTNGVFIDGSASVHSNGVELHGGTYASSGGVGTTNISTTTTAANAPDDIHIHSNHLTGAAMQLDLTPSSIGNLIIGPGNHLEPTGTNNGTIIRGGGTFIFGNNMYGAPATTDLNLVTGSRHNVMGNLIDANVVIGAGVTSAQFLLNDFGGTVTDSGTNTSFCFNRTFGSASLPAGRVCRLPEAFSVTSPNTVAGDIATFSANASVSGKWSIRVVGAGANQPVSLFLGTSEIQGTTSAGGSIAFTGAVTATNLNDILWVGPGSYSTIAAAVAAATPPAIIGIRSTYAGTECPAAVNTNLIFWDFRNGTETCTQNSVSWNQSTSSGQHAMQRMIWQKASPASSDTAFYQQAQFSGTMPASSTMEGGACEADSSGTMVSIPGTSNLIGCEFDALLNSTGQTWASVYAGFSRITSAVSNTTNVTNAAAYRAGAYTKNGSETVANSYGVYADEQTAGGTRNYALTGFGLNLLGFGSNFNAAGLDAEDSAHVPHRFLLVDASNNTIIRAIGTNGLFLQDSTGTTQLKVTSTGPTDGTNNPLTRTIASGTATMPTAAIAAGACSTTVTVAATGVLTIDSIAWSFNAAPAANPAQLVVSAWPTANNVNFQYCNPSAGSITPNAATLNFRVPR